MTHIMKTTFTAVAILSLTACGGESSKSAGGHSNTGDDKMDHTQMDHSKMAGSFGHTTGIIISVGTDGKEVIINHQEIEGIGMGAMTMGFGVTSAVDLSGFAKGDEVSFMVKKGLDNNYRITAMCNTDKEGADCLDMLMNHKNH